MTPAISVAGLTRRYRGQLALDQITLDQVYPDFKVRHAVRVASWFYPNWDEDLAGAMLEEFSLPLNRRIKKLSRGMRSALAQRRSFLHHADAHRADRPAHRADGGLGGRRIRHHPPRHRMTRPRSGCRVAY
jgi:hypothetical protein